MDTESSFPEEWRGDDGVWRDQNGTPSDPERLPPGVPQALPEGKRWHFFICHHQGSGGDQSHILCKDLQQLGYEVWYDNAQSALHRNLDGMRTGVRQSMCLLIFLSGRKETDGVADLQGLYEGPFTRWFCHEEMATAHEHGLRCIGVMETDERKGEPDVGLEKSRALTGGDGGRPVNPNAKHNIHLLDDVCFIPFRRQQHEVDAMLAEIQKQALRGLVLQPYTREPEKPRQKKRARDVVGLQQATQDKRRRPTEAFRNGRGRTCYMHLALQAPQMLIGQKVSCGAINDRLAELESSLEHDKDQWTSEGRFPVCLSDASVPTCNVEDQLRQGSIHCLVWCARGNGWESRAATESMPSLDCITAAIRECSEACAPPSIAVVCLQYGARKAAAQLADAGVKNVLWLVADMMSEGCADVISKAVAPAIQWFDSGKELDEVSKSLGSTLATLAEQNIPGIGLQSSNSFGCIHNTAAVAAPAWKSLSASPHEEWICKRGLDTPQAINMSEDELTNPLLACDLECLKQVCNSLLACRTPSLYRVSIVSDGERAGAGRRRAIAREVCKHCLHMCKHMARVSSASDVDAITQQTNLVWLDLLDAITTVDDLRCLNQKLDGLQQMHIMLTCDDDFMTNKAKVEQMEILDEELRLEEKDIGTETGLHDVYADDLVDDFKVLATFGGEQTEQNLLDVFNCRQLAEVIQKLIAELTGLEERPVIGIYHADEENGILFRLCVTDVAFLHIIRDKFIQEIFSRRLEEALRDTTRKEGRDKLGEVSIKVDLSHFAERYETNILRLDKLTPHQRQKLGEVRAGSEDVHIKAPAGAGKTFLALHQAIELLQRDNQAQVLFVAKNCGLAFFVVKWIAERIEGRILRNKLLSRLHLLFDPFSEGLRTASVKNDFIHTKQAGATPAKFALVVIDEAHHIFRDEQLRTVVERYSSVRRILLSDVSQGLFDDVQFPTGMADIRLEEVVRCTKRVVSAGKSFQPPNSAAKSTRCHHESEGPPLKSFLYNVDSTNEERRFEIYAAKTMKAIQHVTDTFKTLNLNGRVAIVVPDVDFRSLLAPHLQSQLEAVYPGRFELQNAVQASQLCILPVGGASARATNEKIVMDDVSQLDGMEWLIVICVGLDTKPGDEGTRSSKSFAESRSRLYRGITRAHMMALAVNEMIPSGWLAFLTNVRLREDRQFDGRDHVHMAKEHQKMVAVENKRRQDHETRVSEFIADQNLQVQLLADEFAFVIQQLRGAIGAPDLRAVVEAARTTGWPRQQQTDRVLKLIGTTAEFADDNAKRAARQLATAFVRSGHDADTAMTSVLETWREANHALEQVIDEQRLSLHTADLSSLQADILFAVASGGTVSESAANVCANWVREDTAQGAFKLLSTPASSFDPAELRALHSLVSGFVARKRCAKDSAEDAIKLWHDIESVVQDLRVHSPSRAQVAEIVHRYAHQLVGLSGNDMRSKVEREVKRWQASKRQELELEKKEQSIWDASGNETERVLPKKPFPVGEVFTEDVQVYVTQNDNDTPTVVAQEIAKLGSSMTPSSMVALNKARQNFPGLTETARLMKGTFLLVTGLGMQKSTVTEAEYTTKGPFFTIHHQHVYKDEPYDIRQVIDERTLLRGLGILLDHEHVGKPLLHSDHGGDQGPVLATVVGYDNSSDPETWLIRHDDDFYYQDIEVHELEQCFRAHEHRRCPKCTLYNESGCPKCNSNLSGDSVPIAHDLFNNGNRLYKDGRFGEAAVAFSKALQAGYSDEALVYSWRGTCYDAMSYNGYHKYVEAFEDHNKAIVPGKRATLSAASYRIGSACQLSPTLTQKRRVLEIADPTRYFNRGRLYLHFERPAEAMQDFQYCLKLQRQQGLDANESCVSELKMLTSGKRVYAQHDPQSEFKLAMIVKEVQGGCIVQFDGYAKSPPDTKQIPNTQIKRIAPSGSLHEASNS